MQDRIINMNRRHFLRLGALSAPIALAACSPLRVINAVVPDDGVDVIADLAYGTVPRQMLDIYRPKATMQPLPVVLFFYGGSWKNGRRADYAFVGHSLAQQGFLCAVADYRVYPEVTFPGFVEDGASAIAWLADNAQAHGGEAGRINLMGHSAGAHIAAMLALDARYLDATEKGLDVLGRWVGLAGPYAFYPSEVRSVRDIFAQLPEDRARPITFAGPGAPPALLLHGTADRTVYPWNSVHLSNTLQEHNVTAAVKIYDGIGHAPLVLSLAPPFTGIASTLEHSVAFLKFGSMPELVAA